MTEESKLNRELLETLAVVYYAARVEPVALGRLIQIFVSQGWDDADIMALGRHANRIADEANETRETQGPQRTGNSGEPEKNTEPVCLPIG